MVVAQIVRLRNTTTRTFYVEPGDVFSTPRVDGEPCGPGPLEVTPGYDQALEGLVIPWETMTGTGLVIREGEADKDKMLRCVVGPRPEDADNRDWLRLHASNWDPLAVDRWTSVGKRHLLGTIGGSSDFQLTFRDARANGGSPSPSKGSFIHAADQAQAGQRPGAALDEVVHFDRAVIMAPSNTVFLNVFDLASALSIPNSLLCNTVFCTIGAFHAAVEVYGEEWGFYRTPCASACGVCRSPRPRNHPVHVYRQSIDLGRTTLKDWEVRYLIRAKLALKWPGGDYELLSRNCIHFCDELLLSLGVRSVPPWVRGLHETGHAILRVPWPLSWLLGYGGERRTLPPPGGDDGSDTDEQEDNNDEPLKCTQMSAVLVALQNGGGRDSSSFASPGAAIDSGPPPPGAGFIDISSKEQPELLVSADSSAKAPAAETPVSAAHASRSSSWW